VFATPSFQSHEEWSKGSNSESTPRILPQSSLSCVLILTYPLINFSSDIDLFLYGLKDEEAAKEKMLEIYESIKACARADVTCIRSTHAVTIVCEWPQRYDLRSN